MNELTKSYVKELKKHEISYVLDNNVITLESTHATYWIDSEEQTVECVIVYNNNDDITTTYYDKLEFDDNEMRIIEFDDNTGMTIISTLHYRYFR